MVLQPGTYYVQLVAYEAGTSPYELVITESSAPAVSVADTHAYENDEDPALEFPVTLDKAFSREISVQWKTSNTDDATATVGVDYVASSGELAFTPGETEKTITVPIIDDYIDDNGETVVVRLSQPREAVISTGMAIGTITNVDFGASDQTAGYVRLWQPCEEFEPLFPSNCSPPADPEGGPYDPEGNFIGYEVHPELKYKGRPGQIVIHPEKDADGNAIWKDADNNPTWELYEWRPSQEWAPIGRPTAGDYIVTSDIGFAGDLDWYRVRIPSGTNVFINVRGLSTGHGTLPDPQVKLYDNMSAELTAYTVENNNNGSGYNARVVLPAPNPAVAREIYVEVSSADSRPGWYQLEVTTHIDDCGASIGTACTIPLNGVLSGEGKTGEIIEAGDTDWFAVKLAGSQKYEIEVTGSKRPTSRVFPMYVDDEAEPRDPEGTLLDPVLVAVHKGGTTRKTSATPVPGTYDDNSGEGRHARLIFRTTASTEDLFHYIEIGANLFPGESAGTYGLYVRPVSSSDDALANTSTAKTITVSTDTASQTRRSSPHAG